MKPFFSQVLKVSAITSHSSSLFQHPVRAANRALRAEHGGKQIKECADVCCHSRACRSANGPAFSLSAVNQALFLQQGSRSGCECDSFERALRSEEFGTSAKMKAGELRPTVSATARCLQFESVHQ
jgi:hypothetical protein